MPVPDLAQISTQLDSPNSRDRMIALASLREISNAEAVPLIKKVLEDEVLQIRSMAVFEALGNLPCEKSLSALKFLAKDEHFQVNQAAQLALQRLQIT